ncbi:MAG: GlsB/YeaQ/YmgE family stress response membrane protein [Streptosporangiales bacterium]|nr:GlsB/YeaQ/YmgE family stress response membrane protein [Streptosporangiales bacterium]
MDITGILSALVVGVVIGFGGRLLAPGKQKIRWWMTIGVGIIAALIGTVLAAPLGVADTPGFDWLELVIQLVLAAVGVSVLAGLTGRNRRHD